MGLRFAFRIAGATLSLGLLAPLAGAPAARAEEGLVFVVNRDNPATSLSAAEVSDLFLKKRTQWPDGTPVRFVDWSEGSAPRAQFLDSVLNRSARDVELYWIGQKLYTGNTAPIRVSSPSMVISFVSRFKGAIGYLPAGAAVEAPGVKKVEVRGR